MSKIYRILLPQYGDSFVEIMFAETAKEGVEKHPVLSKMKEFTEQSYASNGCTFFIEDTDTGESGVSFIVSTSTKDTERIITHECFHVVMQLAHSLGITVDINNHEPLAYLMDYVNSEALKYYNEYKAIEGEK